MDFSILLTLRQDSLSSTATSARIPSRFLITVIFFEPLPTLNLSEIVNSVPLFGLASYRYPAAHHVNYIFRYGHSESRALGLMNGICLFA